MQARPFCPFPTSPAARRASASTAGTRGPVRTRSRSFFPLLARYFLLSTPHAPYYGYMPLKHPLGILVPHSRIFGGLTVPPGAESREHRAASSRRLPPRSRPLRWRICTGRAPEKNFPGSFRSRAARWMCRVWSRSSSPRTAAFTAHVTIHVHIFPAPPNIDGHEHEIGGVSFEFSCRQPPDCCGSPPVFLALLGMTSSCTLFSI